MGDYCGEKKEEALYVKGTRHNSPIWANASFVDIEVGH
jgi:hypothetical protein